MGRSSSPVIWLSALVIAGGATAARAAEDAEPLSIFAGSIATAVWTLIIFIVLFLVLGKFAWKPLLEALQKREEAIRSDIEAAKQQREDAERMLAEYRRQLDAAQAEAEKVIKQSAIDADKLRTDMLEQAQAQARDTLDKARAQVELAKQDALREIYRQSAALASDLAAKIIEREVNAEDHRVLIQSAVQELESRTNGS